jgi:hypothetical protein
MIFLIILLKIIMLFKIFYISFSLIIITSLLYNNSSKLIIKISNDELRNLKEFDNLIYNITILNNYIEKIINNKNKKYNEIINIIEKSNIEIEKINKEIEKLKSEL